MIRILIVKMLRRFQSSMLKMKLSRGNVLGKNVQIACGTELGQGCKIMADVRLATGVSLCDNVKVGRGVFLENISVGNNSVIDSRVLITGHGPGRIKIGHDSYVGPDTALDFSDDIWIGDYVHIAGLSTGLWTHTSARMCLNSIPLEDKSPEHRPTAPIVVEDNVYIGGNCTIYPGVRVGHHSVIAPNSAVTKDVLPYSLVGGVPAQKIRDTDYLVDGKSNGVRQITDSVLGEQTASRPGTELSNE